MLFYIILQLHVIVNSARSIAPKARSEDGRVSAAVGLSPVRSAIPVLEFVSFRIPEILSDTLAYLHQFI